MYTAYELCLTVITVLEYYDTAIILNSEVTNQTKNEKRKTKLHGQTRLPAMVSAY